MRGSVFLSIFISLSVLLISYKQVLTYFGLNIMARRHYRNSLVSTVINKLNEEEHLSRLVSSGVWYSLNNPQNITDAEIQSRFVQLSLDTETDEFIKHSVEQSDWLFTQIYHNFAKAFLGWFYTQTDINGILGRGSMFVISREQFNKLTDDFKGESLIDLGAGDGNPTMILANSFSKVYATETSAPMRKMLAAKNIQVLEVESWHESGPFDFVSCLNLLDRADNPVTILKTIRKSLKPTGYLMIALVLPFKPYVEYTETHQPSEKLNVQGSSEEAQLMSAVHAVQSLGYQLTKWSKVPYLCEGDLSQPLYHLTDYVMIFKPI